MTKAGRGTPLLIAVCVAGILAGCNGNGKTGATKSAPLGCVDLGNAENGFKAADAGITNGTMTMGDVAKTMGSVQSNLQTAAQVSPGGVFAAAATSGAIYAGRARVALLGGDQAAAATDIGRLQAQINRADPLCTP